MYVRNIGLRWQLLLICVTLVTVPVVISGTWSYITSKQEIYESVEEKLREQTVMIANHLETGMETIQKKVNSDLNVARHILSDHGQPVLDTDNQMDIEATHQLTKAPRTITIPTMTVHEQPVAFHYEIVDQIQHLVGGTATIFQVIPEGLLRISTNVLKRDGTRAVGTYIPKESPVYQSVMSGETFYGRAYVVNAWYQTAYEPITSQDDIIGVLYVGVKDASEPILDDLADIVIGKTGYIWILNKDGEYVLSLNRERTGESILDYKDENGRFFAREWVEIAPTLEEGETRIDYYPWKNPGEDTARMKVAAYSYFEEWDWIIGSSTYIGDFTASLDYLKRITIGVSLTAIVLGAIVAYLFTTVMVKRFTDLAFHMNSVASGNLNVKILSHIGTNEIGQMWRAFAKMAENLKKLVSNVVTTVNEVDTSAETISREMQMLSHSMEQQSDSVDEVTDSAENITQFIDGIRADTDELLAATEEVLSSIHQMNATIHEVTSNTGSLTTDLQHISSAIDHVKDSITHISQSSEQLVSNAQHTEHEIHAIDESFHNVSENADKSRELAEETRSAALQGQKSVDASIQGMKELKDVVSDSANVIQEVNSWSTEVSSILGIVDEIAEQTSLLALNASIISAQAGEHGKGFAVVADEIKELATRTKDSTKEIGTLIRTLQAKTADGVKSIGEEIAKADKGVQLVSAVKDSLNTILDSATRSSSMAADTAQVIQQTAHSSQTIRTSISSMTDMVSAITAAIQEEEQDISKIVKAVEHIRTMSDQVNQANVEHTKASGHISESMEIITQNLSHIADQTKALKNNSDQIVSAMQRIEEVTEHIEKETAEIAGTTVKNLENRSDVLQRIVNVFNVT